MNEDKHNSLLVKRLPPSETPDRFTATRRPRIWLGTPPQEYQGQSRYGPCTFYYFPDTYTWLVRCHNKFRRQSQDRPLVIDHPDGRDFYDDPDLMQALGHPDVTPIFAHGVVAPPTKEKYPGYHKMRNSIFMGLYADYTFQRPPLKIGDYFGTHLARNRMTSESQIEGVVGFAEPGKFEKDGNWMWVAWRDKKKFLEDTPLSEDVMTHIVMKMVNLDATAGYTGIYKTQPVITRDAEHMRVDCAHNLSFWAEMYF
jgi:hypothetical protein